MTAVVEPVFFDSASPLVSRLVCPRGTINTRVKASTGQRRTADDYTNIEETLRRMVPFEDFKPSSTSLMGRLMRAFGDGGDGTVYECVSSDGVGTQRIMEHSFQDLCSHQSCNTPGTCFVHFSLLRGLDDESVFDARCYKKTNDPDSDLATTRAGYGPVPHWSEDDQDLPRAAVAVDQPMFLGIHDRRVTMNPWSYSVENDMPSIYTSSPSSHHD